MRKRDEEDMIATLSAQVQDLKAKNGKLSRENEKLTEQYERKKREVSILSKGKKASAGAGGAVTRRPSPDRPATPGAVRPKGSALMESRDIDIKATKARRSQDSPLVIPKQVGSLGASTAASAAFRDEGLLQITQQLQAR